MTPSLTCPEAHAAYNLALFTAVRGEGRFLREWLAYHLLVPQVGFEHAFVHVQDDAGGPDFRATEAALAPFVALGLVDYVCRPVSRDPDWQLRCWKELLEAYGGRCRWALLTDADCFLFPPGGDTVPRAVARFEDAWDVPGRKIAGLGVYTCTFGSSGLEHSPPLRTASFLRRAPLDARCNWTANYLLRPGRMLPPSAGESYAMAKPGFRIVDTAGVEIGKGKRRGPLDLLRLNHYSVGAAEDWARKVARGWPEAAKTWTDPNHTVADHKKALLDRNDEFDDSLPRRLGPALGLALTGLAVAGRTDR